MQIFGIHLPDCAASVTSNLRHLLAVRPTKTECAALLADLRLFLDHSVSDKKYNRSGMVVVV